MGTSKPISFVSLLWAVLLATSSSEAQNNWYVDDDCSPPGAGSKNDPFCTIQQGVDAAQNEDTVLVGSGTYTGDSNRDISLFGKRIMLESIEGPHVTIMDLQGGPSAVHRGFFLIHGETPETLIEGFTIKNGYLIGDTGGSGPAGGGGGAAICIRDSSPTVRSCVVTGNTSATLGQPFLHDGRGGGIYIDRGSNAIIENCLIAQNVSEKRGGGVMHIGDEENSATIRNCNIVGNVSLGNFPGGGIHNSGGNTTIINTTIVYNTAVTGSGGGIHNEQSEPFVSNSLLWGNEAISGQQIFLQGLVFSIEYSTVQGGLAEVEGCCNYDIDWGPGMIDADPLFFDPDNGDYHVLPGSPVIDAGNNLAVPESVETDLDGNPRFVDDPNVPDTGNPDGVHPLVDMGAYEFQPDDCNHNETPDAEDLAEGSSEDCDGNLIPDECEAVTCADLDGDSMVGITDLLSLLTSWGSCPGCCDADFDGDDDVGISDLLELLAGWGACA